MGVHRRALFCVTLRTRSTTCTSQLRSESAVRLPETYERSKEPEPSFNSTMFGIISKQRYMSLNESFQVGVFKTSP